DRALLQHVVDAGEIVVAHLLDRLGEVADRDRVGADLGLRERNAEGHGRASLIGAGTILGCRLPGPQAASPSPPGSSYLLVAGISACRQSSSPSRPVSTPARSSTTSSGGRPGSST